MKVNWRIDKIKCNGCVETIKRKLGEIKGISNLNTDLSTKMVSFDAVDSHTVDDAKRSLSQAGFTPC
ncbi:heavy-metal-associated domain-containing protein [bacterium]|nr:heavy-metal-associated domain-containing protein [bacterium]